MASDIAGYRDVVSHGTDGLLVPAGDPVELGEALRSLAADPAAAAHITIMVDHPAQLDLIATAAAAVPEAVVRVCIDIDGSLKVAGLHTRDDSPAT